MPLRCYSYCSSRSAWPVHEDLVTGVDQPVQQRLGDDEVGELAIPIDRGAVGGEQQAAPCGGSGGDELVEVVGLIRGELADLAVVEDQQGGGLKIDQ